MKQPKQKRARRVDARALAKVAGGVVPGPMITWIPPIIVLEPEPNPW